MEWESDSPSPQPYTPQTVQWLGAGVQGVWSNPWVRAAVDCGKTAGGSVREETVVGNDCGGKLGSRGNKEILLSHGGDGAITIASLSPHTSIGSWTSERLAHQMPDAPHGAALSAWQAYLQSRTPIRGAPLCAWYTEPHRRATGKEALKCLNRWSYRERPAKGAFWSPATGGSKKDW